MPLIHHGASVMECLGLCSFKLWTEKEEKTFKSGMVNSLEEFVTYYISGYKDHRFLLSLGINSGSTGSVAEHGLPFFMN